MTTPHEIGMEQDGPNGDGAMFNLKSADKAESATRIASRPMDVADEESGSSDDSGSDADSDSDEDGDRLDRELDTLYETYQQRKEESDAKQRAKRARKQRQKDDFEGFSGSESEIASDDDKVAETILPLRPAAAAEGLSNRAAIFFDQDIFQDLGIADSNHDDDSAIEINDDEDHRKIGESSQQYDRVQSEESNVALKQRSESRMRAKSASALTTEQPEQGKRQTRDEQASQAKGKDSKIEQVKDMTEDDEPRKKNGQLDIDIITAEAMALAQSIATGEKTTADLTDDGFNKYSFRDVDGLPDWFLDDEGKHSKLQRPITAAAAAAIREKLRALNARPIKKVREAKSRKMFRAAQRLEKLKKKSALLLDDDGISEKDKASTIAKLMSKASKRKPKEKVKLVVATGGNRGIAGRPRGVKGRYKIVDRRLKKDVRAEKRLAKKKKK